MQKFPFSDITSLTLTAHYATCSDGKTHFPAVAKGGALGQATARCSPPTVRQHRGQEGGRERMEGAEDGQNKKEMG